MANSSTRRTRLVILGGFLGAGKTTTLLRIADDLARTGRRVAVITNDQADDLADTHLFRAAGLPASEVGGGCFCCRFGDFIARASELKEAVRPDVVLAEPVGSCTDIVATVVKPLRRAYGNQFDLAPFTVVVDPVRALKVLDATERVVLSERVTYIYRLQQQEASILAINKIDQLTIDTRARVCRLLADRFHSRRVVAYSALTGEGFDDLRSCLESTDSDDAARLDVDYDIYAAGEAELAWLNAAVDVSADRPTSMDALALGLVTTFADALRERDMEPAHCKVLLEGDGRHAIANIVDSERGPRLSFASDSDSTFMRLTLNMRVQTTPGELDGVTREAVAMWTRARGLRVGTVTTKSFSPPRPVPTHRVTAAGA